MNIFIKLYIITMSEAEEYIGDSYTYNEKLNNLKTEFFSVLEDFKKYYVYYNKNPEVNEFQNYYSNSKSQLQNISKNVVSITNEINKKIDVVDGCMSKIAQKIEQEKKLNDELSLLSKELKNTNNGSEILINDTKTEYNKQYYSNINMAMGIVLVSMLLTKLFKDQ